MEAAIGEFGAKELWRGIYSGREVSGRFLRHMGKTESREV